MARLIDASSGLFERTLLMVLYGTGMRRVRDRTAEDQPTSTASAWSFMS